MGFFDLNNLEELFFLAIRVPLWSKYCIRKYKFPHRLQVNCDDNLCLRMSKTVWLQYSKNKTLRWHSLPPPPCLISSFVLDHIGKLLFTSLRKIIIFKAVWYCFYPWVRTENSASYSSCCPGPISHHVSFYKFVNIVYRILYCTWAQHISIYLSIYPRGWVGWAKI